MGLFGGCGNNGCGCGNGGMDQWIWIIVLLFCCGGDCICGILDEIDDCWIWIIILFCFCGKNKHKPAPLPGPCGC